MFARILRHEWRMLLADPAPWVLLAVLAASIGYGTLNGVRWTRFQEQTIERARAEERERLAQHDRDLQLIAAGEKKVAPAADPGNADSAGRRLATRYAVLPPLPLAPLTVGQSDLLPYYFRISTDSREAALAATEIENPHRLLSGRFDLAFVLIYVYPLFILGLAYNLLSAEKEQGTLALALSQPVSVRTLVAGKVTLRLLVFLVAIVLLAGMSLAAAGIDLSAPETSLRLGLWAAAAAVAVYGLFWLALAVAVTAFGRPSATNAAVLAACWLLFTVVLPSAGNLVANTLYPVPSRVALVQGMRVASDEANTRGSQLLAKYYEDHPELAPDSVERAMTQASLIRIATTADIERQIQPVLDTFGRQRASQRRVIAGFTWLSPALLMQHMLGDIAGTGTHRHERFVEQVARFHEEWRAYFLPRVFGGVRLERVTDAPQFAFEDESAPAVLDRTLPGLVFLLMLGLGISVAGGRALSRYPIVG
jgi:ABC-2 type transport system permease protein